MAKGDEPVYFTPPGMRKYRTQANKLYPDTEKGFKGAAARRLAFGIKEEDKTERMKKLEHMRSRPTPKTPSTWDPVKHSHKGGVKARVYGMKKNGKYYVSDNYISTTDIESARAPILRRLGLR